MNVTIRKQSSFIALLLLVGNIELSRGPSSSPQTQFSLRLMNVRFAVSKAALIHDVISDHRLDLVALTETWITSDTPNVVCFDVAPVGYRVIHAHHRPTLDKRGGRIAFVFRKSNDVRPRNWLYSSTFESLVFEGNYICIDFHNCMCMPTAGHHYN